MRHAPWVMGMWERRPRLCAVWDALAIRSQTSGTDGSGKQDRASRGEGHRAAVQGTWDAADSTGRPGQRQLYGLLGHKGTFKCSHSSSGQKDNSDEQLGL